MQNPMMVCLLWLLLLLLLLLVFKLTPRSLMLRREEEERFLGDSCQDSSELSSPLYEMKVESSSSSLYWIRMGLQRNFEGREATTNMVQGVHRSWWKICNWLASGVKEPRNEMVRKHARANSLVHTSDGTSPRSWKRMSYWIIHCSTSKTKPSLLLLA